jgi:thiosulfate dehydrogenase
MDSHVTPSRVVIAIALSVLTATACSSSRVAKPSPVTATTPLPPRTYALAGPLVPASTTMISAWDVPANPLTDRSLDGSPQGERIRRGYRIFTNTPTEASAFTHGTVSCSNCHLNAGQRERALPLVGVAAVYPEMNRRAERQFTLEDRIIDCFTRSENGTEASTTLPTRETGEVVAVAAYLEWLSKDFESGSKPAWRGKNTIAAEHLLPLSALEPSKGEALFLEKCTACHGQDGQGVEIGDKKAAPLWGPSSWNDGAGAARVYTLAGIIRYAMPYLDPGSLTDEEAQLLAAFITSKERPAYPFKDKDYVNGGPPVDAVYYKSPNN